MKSIVFTTHIHRTKKNKLGFLPRLFYFILLTNERTKKRRDELCYLGDVLERADVVTFSLNHLAHDKSQGPRRSGNNFKNEFFVSLIKSVREYILLL